VPTAPTLFHRTDWAAELGDLLVADAAGGLEAAGLARLGLALELTGRTDEAVEAWDRARREHLAGGDFAAAARCMFWTGFTLGERRAAAPAAARLGEMAALVGAVPEDEAAAALLLIAEGWSAFSAGRLEDAVSRLQLAAELAERAGDADALLIATMSCGRAAVLSGDIAGGFACMDRVMLLISEGGANDLAAGAAYCAVIASCLGRRDVERAREWTTALSGWCQAQEGLVPFRGTCVLHRAALLQLGGAWPEAERTVHELLQAPAVRVPRGDAAYQEAELLRLTGRGARADAAYRAAVGAGREAQPGLALLRLAQGQADVARSGLERALVVATPPGDRADLLDALVEVCLAVGDQVGADAAAAELRALADLIGTSFLRAQSDRARGRAALAGGDPAGAVRLLRRAWSSWQAVGAPYEAARTRVDAALAARALGDEDAAGMELDAARQSFTELGAAPDIVRVDAALIPPRSPHPAGPLSLREAEVLRLVARGSSNRAIAERLFLSERTVAHHVGNILAKLQLANRAAATAFAYEHGLVDADSAARMGMGRSADAPIAPAP
jgi:DNA-binding NarL/FixJ family response regulator